jgi:soluble lytic murein transglycosylase-like protein
MNPMDRWFPRIVLAAALVVCGLDCTAEAQPAREARQALRILCPKRVSLAPAFARAAERYAVPAALLVAMGRKESNCDPKARGKLGERGLLQLKPGTLAAGRVPIAHLDRPATNVDLGARHLLRCLLLCGDLAGGLGVYSGRKTCRLGRASPYARRVMGFYELAINERKQS